MNIADIHRVSKLLVSYTNYKNVKKFIYSVPKDVVIVVVFILGLSVSFGFGVIAGKQMKQGGIIVETIPINKISENKPKPTYTNNTAIQKDLRVVASKKGSKYYFSWCSGAKRLSTANKVWFASAEKAQKSGYSKASNCKGL